MSEGTKMKPKKKVAPVLSDPIDRGRQSIHYVLSQEERDILFRGAKQQQTADGGDTSNKAEDAPAETKSEEKSALTCVLLLMFEELEHQPIVYEKLLTSELFEGCLKKVPGEQTELVRKILTNS